jgi:hypothetical protein
MEKLLNVKVSLKIDGENKTAKIENMSLESATGELTYKQKALKHFKEQLRIRKERVESYQTAMDTPISPERQLEKMKAEQRYYDLQEIISQLEIIE